MAVQACFLDIRHILSFGVVLSLFQLILVSASVIILRYRYYYTSTMTVILFKSVSVYWWIICVSRPTEITKTHHPQDITATDNSGVAQNILSAPSSPLHNGSHNISLDSAAATASATASTTASATISTAATAALLENLEEEHDENKSKYRNKEKRRDCWRTSDTQQHVEEIKEQKVLPGTIKPQYKCLKKYLNFAPGTWVCVAVFVMWAIMLLIGAALIYGR